MTIPLARKRPFRRVGSSRPTGKLQNSITYHLPNSRRRYMVEILPIQQNPQSINQSINQLCDRF